MSKHIFNSRTKKQFSHKPIQWLLFIFIYALCSNALAKPEPLDRVIAVVDNDVVMESELAHRLQMIQSQLARANKQPPPVEVLTNQVLEQLILESLQLQIGARIGISISDEELNQQIQRIQQQNNLTDDQFQAQLNSDGLSLPLLKNQMNREMIIDQVQRGSVNRRINISNQEVDAYLRSKQGQSWASPSYHLGHILVGVSLGSDIQEAKDKAETLVKRLRDGEDFSNMAIAESNGQMALQGGDLGWRKSTELPTLFSEQLSSMSAGDITDPFRSGAGFHILKVKEIRGAQEQIIQQAKVRHILIKPTEILSDAEAKQKLEALREQIISGASFEETAKQQSEDSGSKLGGGDLGWSLPGQFVPIFEQTMDATPTGEISQPFRSQFGWHILKVDERRNQDMSERVRRNQASRILRNQRFEEERFLWLQEIKDQAYIDIKQPEGE